tara:strand:+ start:190 stop:399 length:210 start_codon:yes stop_codon:yes gene_type:complete
MIKRLKDNYTGKFIISIILGLGIAALFRKVCNDRDCIVIKGPDVKETEKSIFAFDGKCYKYKAKATRCL